MAQVSPGVSTRVPERCAYTYTPLTPGTQSIRLLSFVNIDDIDQIAVKLAIFDLKQTPPFIALSYTWGPTEPKTSIMIDGCEHQVRQNLHTMLRQLQRWKQKAANRKRDWTAYVGDSVIGTSMMRLDYESTRYYMNSPEYWLYFWIDALCIDDGNIAERSEQVGLMNNIFTDAAFVLVWLGEKGEDGKSAMKIISAHRRSGDPESTREPGWATASLENKAIRAFCRRPYWKRLWIVQEVILARDILVCCGSMRVEWDKFEDWYLAMKKEFPGICHITSAAGELVEQRIYWTTRRLISPTGVLGGRKAAQLRRINNGQLYVDLSAPSLIMLVDSFLFYECSVVHDKVFALLGLVDDRHLAPLDINVDYSLSPWQLYEEVVGAVKKHINVRLLASRRWDTPDVVRFSRLLRIALGLEEQRLDFGW